MQPTNTFGHPVSVGGGSPVPQTPPGNAVIPTLNASYAQAPTKPMNPPAVVTSGAAEDHVNGMTNASQQGIADTLNLNLSAKLLIIALTTRREVLILFLPIEMKT